MFMFLFFIPLVILQVIMLIRALIKKQKIIWNDLYWLEIISLSCVLIDALIYKFIDVSNSFGTGIILTLLKIMGVVLGILLIISILIGSAMKDKIQNTQVKSKFPILIGIVISAFVVCTVFEFVPLMNERSLRKEVKYNVITYLKNKYGEENYEIIEIKDLQGGFFGGEPAYELSVKSEYVNEIIKVKVDKISKEIEEDSSN